MPISLLSLAFGFLSHTLSLNSLSPFTYYIALLLSITLSRSFFFSLSLSISVSSLSYMFSAIFSAFLLFAANVVSKIDGHGWSSTLEPLWLRPASGVKCVCVCVWVRGLRSSAVHVCGQVRVYNGEAKFVVKTNYRERQLIYEAYDMYTICIIFNELDLYLYYNYP